MRNIGKRTSARRPTPTILFFQTDCWIWISATRVPNTKKVSSMKNLTPICLDTDSCDFYGFGHNGMDTGYPVQNSFVDKSINIHDNWILMNLNKNSKNFHKTALMNVMECKINILSLSLHAVVQTLNKYITQPTPENVGSRQDFFQNLLMWPYTGNPPPHRKERRPQQILHEVGQPIRTDAYHLNNNNRSRPPQATPTVYYPNNNNFFFFFVFFFFYEYGQLRRCALVLYGSLLLLLLLLLGWVFF